MFVPRDGSVGVCGGKDAETGKNTYIIYNKQQRCITACSMNSRKDNKRIILCVHAQKCGAILLIAGIILLFFAALTQQVIQAQSNSLYSGTMTAGTPGNDPGASQGYLSGSYGTLSSTSFTYGGETYSITSIYRSIDSVLKLIFAIRDSSDVLINPATILPNGSVKISETGGVTHEIPLDHSGWVLVNASLGYGITRDIYTAILTGSSNDELAFSFATGTTATIEIFETGSILVRQNLEDQTYTRGAAIANITLPEAIGGAGNLSYTLTGLPAGLVFNTTTRELSGTPTATAGTFTATYQVTDSLTPTAQTASSTFDITVVLPDTTAPTLTNPSSIGTTSDNTPAFTFTSDEAGTITYGGDCTSTDDTEALAEANTVTFDVLDDGEHSNCTVTVTDDADSPNTSSALAVPTFTIDSTAPVISTIALANDVTDGYLTGSEITNTDALITAPTVTGATGSTTYKLTKRIETSCASFIDYSTAIPQSDDVTSDGIYKICVKAADTLGNTSYRNSPLFIRDTAVPTMSFNSISDGTVDETEDDTDIPITGETSPDTKTLTLSITDQTTTYTKTPTLSAFAALEQKIPANSSTGSFSLNNYDLFGTSVATDGTRIIVGAHHDDDGGLSAGAIYIFKDTNNDNDYADTNEIIKVSKTKKTGGNLSLSSYDRFGRAVATDGTRIIVGAHTDDDGETNAGAIYILEDITNNGDYADSGEIIKVSATQNTGGNLSLTSGDNFGQSVATDGTRIFVGALDNDGEVNTGAIYILEDKNNDNDYADADEIIKVSKTQNTGGNLSLDSNDYFGRSVATDGTRIIVGANQDDDGGTNAGAIYILEDTNNDGDYADSGEIIKVSDTQNTGDNLSLSSSDNFGSSVATDGTRIFVGAGNDDDGGEDAGALYILEDMNNNGDYADSGEITKVTENSNISSLSLASDDYFGSSVATDGTRIVVGAYGDDSGGPDAGAIYTFSLEKTFSTELTSTEMQALDAGTVTVTTTAIADRAGNSGTGSEITFVYEEDTTAPTLSSPSSIGTTNDNTPAFTFTSDEAGTITYGGDCTSTDGTEALAEANTVTFDTLSDGEHSNCTVIVTDAADNDSSALAVPTFTIDSTAPVIGAIALANDVTDGYLTPTEITSTDALITAPTVTGATGSTTYKLTKRIETGCASFIDYSTAIPQSDDVASDGVYKICAKAADTLGNTSYRNSPLFIRDTAGPTVSFDSISDGTVDETEDDTDIPITGETSPDTKTLTLSITDQTTTYTKTPTLSAFAALEQKIPANSSTGSFSLDVNDRFGTSVATDGTRIIVGVIDDDDGGLSAGAIYIFEDTNNDNDYADTNEIIKVSKTKKTGGNLSLDAFDQFGTSVATDGTRIIVGVPLDDDGGSDAGAIYILEDTNDDDDYADSGEIIKVTENSNTGTGFLLDNYDRFGTSVATDGTRIIVGAYSDDDGRNAAGAIYIFEDKNNDNDYADADEIIKISRTQNTGGNLLLDGDDFFGRSVATDGTRIIVGANQDDDGGNNAGAVYIFEDTNNDGDYAESGEIIKVSDTQNTGDNLSLSSSDNFGSSVATDGTRIIVGAYQDDDGGSNAGAIYILEDINDDDDYADSGEITKVTENSNISSLSLTSDDYFGSSVATDGTTIFVGADQDNDGGLNAGAIYTFSLEKTFSTELTSTEMQALNAGTITVTATTITDRAGNSGTGSETTFAYSITNTDTTAPTLSSPSSIGTTNDNTPEFTFTSDEAGAITYEGDCTSTDDTEAASGANTVTFDVLDDGAHSNCTVTVTDNADTPNTSAALAVPTFTIDTTAPVISAIALANDVTDGYLTPTEITNTNNLITAPTVTGATGSTTYKLTKREANCASFQASDYTATIPQSDDVTSDGIYKICAKAADALSNTSYRNAPLFIRDTAVPTMSFNSISDGTVDETEDDNDIPITGETSADTKTITLSITDQATTYTETPTLSAFATLEQKITENSNTGFLLDNLDNFGRSVTTDGTRIIVGANYDDDGESNAGAIYILEDTNDNGDYTESGEIIKISKTQNTGENLSLSSGDFFGYSVTTDGTRIIVGAHSDDSGESNAGAIYILEDTNDDDDYADSGEIIKVSATQNTGGNLSLNESDHFGSSVATDGTRIIVGTPRNDDNGTDTGALYILEDKNDDNDYADNGEIIKVSDTQNTGGNLSLSNSDYFGQSVATDGTRIFVGATGDDDDGSGAGALYILEDKNSDGDYAESGEIIKVNDTQNTGSNLSLGSSDFFGQSVATDGTRIIVGANYDDDGGSDAGALYILEDINNDDDYADSGEITKVTENSNTSSTFLLDASDLFGSSIATDGTTIIVGAYGDDDGGNNAGAIYTFSLEKTFSTELTSTEMQALNTGTVTVAATTITDRAGNSGTESETTFVYEIEDTIYSGTMTAGTPADDPGAARGYLSGSYGTPYGTLSPTSFTYSGETYSVIRTGVALDGDTELTFAIRDSSDVLINPATILPNGSVKISETGGVTHEIPFDHSGWTLSGTGNWYWISIDAYTAILTGSSNDELAFSFPLGTTATIEIFETGSILVRQNLEDQTYTRGAAIANITLPEAIGGAGNLSYTLTGLPAGLVFNTTTRELSGTPTATAGTFTATYQVTDSLTPTAQTASSTFDITVVLPDTTAPTLTNPSSIGTTSDNTPEFTFTSDEAGTITYGGDCTSTDDTEALAEANTVTFDVLDDGEHSNCTVTVTDDADSPNTSSALAVPTFTIDSTAPVISTIALANDVTDGYLTGSEITNTDALITAPTVTGATGSTTYKLTKRIETSCASFIDYSTAVPQSDDVASDGIYKICAKAADTLGNTSYRNAPLFIRDTAGPTVSFDSISDGTVDETEDDNDIPITGETSADTQTLTLSITDATTTYTKTPTLSAFAALEQKITEGSNTGVGFLLDDYDNFGRSVTTDGTRIIVGAPDDGDGETSAGAIYIFEDTNNDGDYDENGEIIKVSDTQNTGENFSLSSYDRFGASVATDGTRIIVGAYSDDDGETSAGAIYILEDTNDDDDYAESGEIIKVSDTQNTGGNLSLDAIDYFGYSVATDGTRIIVGARNDDDDGSNAGAIYILEDKNNDNDYADAGEIIKVTENSNVGANDYFGASVATDGTRIIVGAYGDDDGGSGAGAIYILEDTNSDGDYAESGEIIKVTENSNTGSTFSLDSSDRFGHSVATDGTRIIVGARDDNGGGTNAGAIYILEDINDDDDYAESGEITKVTENSNTDSTFLLDANDYFGSSVAINGTRIIVGAYQDNDGGTNAGAIYTFSLEKTFSTELTSTEMQALNTGTVTVTATTITDRAGNSGTGSETTFAYSITDTDTTAPTLSSPSSIGSTSDNTPEFTFTSDEAGAITYGGGCTSTDTAVIAEANTVTFDTLTEGTYSTCTVTVTDDATNASSALAVPTFTIDTTTPTLSDPSDIGTATGGAEFSFTSDEAGTITYGGGCVSSDTEAIDGENTVTLEALSEGVNSSCTVTVTDAADNASSALSVPAFTFRDAPTYHTIYNGTMVPGSAESGDGTIWGYKETGINYSGLPNQTAIGSLTPNTLTVGTTVHTVNGMTTSGETSYWISIYSPSLYHKALIPKGSMTVTGTTTDTQYELSFSNTIRTNTTEYFFLAEESYGSIYNLFAANNQVSIEITDEIFSIFGANAGYDRAQLTWAAPSGITGISRYQYNQDDSGWSDIPSSTGTTTSYLAEGLSPGVSYEFAIRALDSSNTVLATSRWIPVIPNKLQDGINGIFLLRSNGSSYEYRNSFGSAAALSLDGNTLVVGAQGDYSVEGDSGSVYVFAKDASGAWAYNTKIINGTHGLTIDAGYEFGSSVALSQDESTLIVGAEGRTSLATNTTGTVYIFTKDNNDSWTKSGEITHDADSLPLAAGDKFGSAAALSSDGNTLYVGARGGDTGGDNRGAVYIFTKDSNESWTQSEKITHGTHSLTLSNTDQFGSSLALSSDGNTLVVGAINGNDSEGADRGAIHIFTKDSNNAWTHSTKIDSSFSDADFTISDSDLFGSALAFSLDGSTLLIGTEKDDTGGDNRGAINVFAKDSDGNWTYERKIADGTNGTEGLTLDNGDNFGSSIALSADGGTLFAGATGDYADERRKGALHILDSGIEASAAPILFAPSDIGTTADTTPDFSFYTTEAGTIAYTGDCASAQTAATFGVNVITFGTLSSGTHSDCALTVTDSDSNTSAALAVPEFTITSAFGITVNIGYDKVQLTWGQPSDSANIAKYQYKQDAGSWTDISGSGAATTTHIIENLTPNTGYTFKIRALDSDNAVITESGDITATPDVITIDTAGSIFGFATALSADETVLAIGAIGIESYRGAVYLFTKSNDGIWLQDEVIDSSFNGLTLSSSDHFGNALALSADGSTLFVGARFSDSGYLDEVGAAYVFVKDGSDNWTYETKITHNTHGFSLNAGDDFGYSLTASGDGNTLIVATNRSSMYLFTRDNGVWSYDSKISETTEQVATSVLLSPDGRTLFAGDPGFNDEEGIVYLFTKNNDVWSYSGRSIERGFDGLTLPGAVPRFGHAMALSSDGNTLYIFANSGDGDEINNTMYVFTGQGTSWNYVTSVTSPNAQDFPFGFSLATTSDGNTLYAGFGAYDELNRVRIVKPDLPLSLLGLVDEQRYGKDRAVEAPELPEAIRGVGSVQYTISTLPAGLTFTSSSRRITGTPTTAGTTTMTYTATDQTAGTPQTDSITFDIVIDVTPPTLSDPSDIGTATGGAEFSFTSDEAGTITYGGGCTSSDTEAIDGENTVTLEALSEGVNSSCTVTVTDAAGNASSALSVPAFTFRDAPTYHTIYNGVLVPGSFTGTDGTVWGYKKAGMPAYGAPQQTTFGSLTPDTFTVSTTVYAIAYMITEGSDDPGSIGILPSPALYHKALAPKGSMTLTGTTANARHELPFSNLSNTVAATAFFLRGNPDENLFYFFATNNQVSIEITDEIFSIFGANAGYDKAQLTWAAPSGITGISKYQYNQDDSGWSDIPSSAGATTSYLVEGLSPGVSYEFAIRALDSSNTVLATSRWIPVIPNKLQDETSGIFLFKSSNSSHRNNFGSAAALSLDRNTLYVGTQGDSSTSEDDAGAVYVFAKDASGAWAYSTKITHGTHNLTLDNDYKFGSSIALSQDESMLIVGAEGVRVAGVGNSAGTVYIFTKDNNDNWTKSGEIAYDADSFPLAANDHFGSAAALSSDGNTLFVGARGDDTGGDNRGAVYIFTKDSNESWTYSTKIAHGTHSLTLSNTDRFGSSLALSLDGSTLVVGAATDDTEGTDRGAVHIFTKDSDNNWTHSTKIDSSFSDADFTLSNSDLFGSALAFSLDGSTLLIGTEQDDTGGTNRGAIYVFAKDGDGNWAYERKIANDAEGLTLGNGDNFGSSLALSADGGTLFAGATGDYADERRKGALHILDSGIEADSAPILFALGDIGTTTDSTPDFSFYTTEAGTIAYTGSCSSAQTAATFGVNVITFSTLPSGTHSDCALTVTDSDSNTSAALTVPEFTINTDTPTLSSPSSIGTTADSTPEFTFTSDEAGEITYAGGCTSADTEAIAGTNTVTFSELAEGAHNNCTVTVTHSNGNASDALPVPAFTISSFPTDVTAAAGYDSVTLSWTPLLGGVTGYEYAQNGGAWTAISGSDSTTATYTVSGLTPGETYTFKVRATGGSENVTNAVSVTLLNAVPGIGYNKVRINLTAATNENVSKYQYQWDTGDWTDIPGLSTPTAQIIENLTPGTSYTFTVRALDSSDTVLMSTGGITIVPNRIDHTISTSISNSDHFGFSTATSRDGSMLAVGARGNDTGGTDRGAVHLFTRNNGIWVYTTTIAHGAGGLSLGNGDQFGSSVAFSPEGNTLYVGAWYDDTGGSNRGAVHTFAKNGTVWTHSGKIAHNTNGLTLSNTSEFGSAVALSFDGTALAVGAYANDTGGSNRGAVHIFTKDSDNNWTHSIEIDNSFPDADFTLNNYGNFGSALAFSPDGNTLFVGTRRDNTDGTQKGVVHIFVKDADGNWAYETKIADGTNGTENLNLSNNDRFGSSLALSADGNTLFAGATYDDTGGTNRGTVHVFTKSDGAWAHEAEINHDSADINLADGDTLGHSAALFADDQDRIFLISGAPYSDAGGSDRGIVYIADTGIDLEIIAPILSNPSDIGTTTDTTPDFSFSSTEAGTIAYTGDCTSAQTTAIAGDNVITFSALPLGTYNNCALTVTNDEDAVSIPLTVPSFTIEAAPIVLSNPSDIGSTTDTTPDFSFSSTKAGTIVYTGSCSSSQTTAIAGNNVITFSALPLGTYDDCVLTITDDESNTSAQLTVSSFTIKKKRKSSGGIGRVGNRSGSGNFEEITSFFSFGERVPEGYVFIDLPGIYGPLRSDLSFTPVAEQTPQDVLEGYVFINLPGTYEPLQSTLLFTPVPVQTAARTPVQEQETPEGYVFIDLPGTYGPLQSTFSFTPVPAQQAEPQPTESFAPRHEFTAIPEEETSGSYAYIDLPAAYETVQTDLQFTPVPVTPAEPRQAPQFAPTIQESEPEQESPTGHIYINLPSVYNAAQAAAPALPEQQQESESSEEEAPEGFTFIELPGTYSALQIFSPDEEEEVPEGFVPIELPAVYNTP